MPYTFDGPGYKRMDTAREAAKQAVPKMKKFQGDILMTLEKAGPMTADEVAAHLGASVLSIRPRFTELLTAGKIRDTGQRRENASGRRAAVWEIAA